MGTLHKASDTKAQNRIFLDSLDSQFDDFRRGIENAYSEGQDIYPSSVKEALGRMQNFIVPKRAPPRDRGGLRSLQPPLGEGMEAGVASTIQAEVNSATNAEVMSDDHLIADYTRQATPDDISALTAALVIANTTVCSSGG